MNIRVQKYKQNRLNGLGIYESCVQAGWAESYARSKAWRIEKKVKVSLQEAFGRRGLTDEKIISHALAGLEAEKSYTTKDGEKEVYFGADWTARHKYFETILKLTERVKPDENSSKSGLNQVIIVYPSGEKKIINPPVNRTLEVTLPHENRT